MPYKIWIPGEEVLSADFNPMVQEQVVATFANAAARTTAIAVPKTGQLSWLVDVKRVEAWDGTMWRPIGPHTDARARMMAGNNAISNPGVFTPLPAGADRTALTLSFTKYAADTKLVFQASFCFAVDSGVAGQVWMIGLRRQGAPNVDYELARMFPAGWTLTAPWRIGIMSGTCEVSGIAAGTHVFEPIVKCSTGAAVINFHVSDDFIDYSVTETY